MGGEAALSGIGGLGVAGRIACHPSVMQSDALAIVNKSEYNADKATLWR